MSDSFMIWSFWLLLLAALGYALYSIVAPDAQLTDVPAIITDAAQAK